MKVYEYGCRAPFENAERVAEQMSLAHRYSNVLVEIELKRRAEIRAAQTAHSDVAPLAANVSRLEALLESSREAISLERKKTRSAASKPSDVSDARSLGAELKEARAALRDAKKVTKADPVVVAAVSKANEDSYEAIRKARAASGLFWGTYLIVEQAADAARGGMFDPQFHRWTGDGHLAIQLQKGMDTTEVHGLTDTRVCIETEPGRRARILHFRIGSENNRAPVFAKLSMKMHRELPPGKIKWVHLIRKRIADQYRWLVQFVVDVAEVSVEVARGDCLPSAAGVVGVDVGWRLHDSGDLRVAVAVSRDADGKETVDELVLPARLVSKDEHVSSLASIRSKLMDEMKEKYVTFLAERASAAVEPATTHPDAVGASAAVEPATTRDTPQSHPSTWRNPGRFRRVLDDHQRALVTGSSIETGTPLPQTIVETITAFLKTDQHLWQWQEFERRKVHFQRRELFRLFAVRLTRRYKKIVVEDFDLRVFAKRGEVEDDTQTDTRRYMRLRGLACVSGFRQALKQACLNRHVEYVEVDPAYSTLQCFACKHTNEVMNAAESIVQKCVACGVEWDQDENAARNLVQYGEGVAGLGLVGLGLVGLGLALADSKGGKSKRQTRLTSRLTQRRVIEPAAE